MADRHRAGELVQEEIVHLREDLDAMEAKGALPPKLKALKDELARVGSAAPAARAPVAVTEEGKA
jgi:hypothetical protein